MTKPFPAFEVKFAYHDQACVSWRDDDANRRFHIWVNKGELEEVIHSNWIDKMGAPFTRTNRKLDPSKKTWAALFAHIKAELAAGRLADAKAEFNRQEEAKRAERDAQNEAARKRRIAEEAAPDLLEAAKECLAAELQRRESLKIGAPATTYCETRIAKISAAIAKAEGHATPL